MVEMSQKRKGHHLTSPWRKVAMFATFPKAASTSIVRRSCWLCVDGEQAPVRAEAGDVFLLSAHQSFVLASDVEAMAIDAASVFTSSAVKMGKLGDGYEYMQIGGFVRLDPLSGGYRREYGDVISAMRAVGGWRKRGCNILRPLPR